MGELSSRFLPSIVSGQSDLTKPRIGVGIRLATLSANAIDAFSRSVLEVEKICSNAYEGFD